MQRLQRSLHEFRFQHIKVSNTLLWILFFLWGKTWVHPFFLTTTHSFLSYRVLNSHRKVSLIQKVCVIFPYFLLKSNLNINRYEVTTLRRKLKNSCKEMKHYCCQPLKLFSSLFQFLSWMLVTCITVIFWQPITALFKVIYPLCTSIYHIDTNFLSF